MTGTGRCEAAGGGQEEPHGRDGTVVPGVKRAPGPGRVLRVRNMETVRHEALHDRAEVKGLRRRVVAAARLELRAA